MNTVTAILFLAPWPLWAVWEVFLIIYRKYHPAFLISMEARELGWKLNSVVYLWCGLAAHFWWNSDTTSTVVGTIAFWLLAVILLIKDLLDWNHQAQLCRFCRERNPLIWVGAGVLAGHFLFPQVALTNF